MAQAQRMQSDPAARPALIRKPRDPAAPPPWLPPEGLPAFDWRKVGGAMLGLPGGALNMGYEILARHRRGERAQHTAIRWLGTDGQQQQINYEQLARRANRAANALLGLGLRRGDTVFLLAPRLPQLYATVLGALQAGLVVSPLFSAFGPEPIATRMKIGQARAIVSTEALCRRKLEGIRAQVPTLAHVLLVGEHGDQPPEGALDFDALMAAASEDFEPVRTRPDESALLHFTSGTTGRPKGAVHVHEALLTHWSTGRYALDLHEDDVFWCTADPGWVTGMSYGILAPLLHGVTLVVLEEEFDAERWYQVLAQQRVSVWYTAPTALRMLMKAGAELARGQRFERLRFIASVGEPLNPEAIWWGLEVFGMPIHDNWWQTETGGIMIANTRSLDIKPGSMGKPLPGVQACIVERREDGSVREIDTPGQEGELALRRGWPSMFRAYLNEPERYAKCFSGDYYLSGDLARRDADGYYWFVGRADDVIKSSGHLIGPFEVESALIEHEAVVEAGVIGVPDEMLGERVKAFVSLRPGVAESEALRRELMAHARKRLGPSVAPREIAFVASLPRTRSGKIMRRLLRARELGLPEGDTSTLEAGA